MFDTIAFDADDTLWHNEGLYSDTQARFQQLLEPYEDGQSVERRLYETEMRNLKLFGYGIKGFALSMIETAIELSNGRIQGHEVRAIIDLAKEMLSAPVRPMEHVEDVLSQLSRKYRLMMITKGDLFDQETKIARSGLAGYFDHVEIVSSKSSETYDGILASYGLGPGRFLMVGNSLKSDILPVLEIGGRAVYIPYHITWAHETDFEGDGSPGDYFELEKISQLPALLDDLAANQI
jgi:putative hydrolase of the HAD superfamily